jgi:hypothetical protein
LRQGHGHPFDDGEPGRPPHFGRGSGHHFRQGPHSSK